jgi:hypothetical protein
MSMALFEENLEIRSTTCFISPRRKNCWRPFGDRGRIIESEMPMDYRSPRSSRFDDIAARLSNSAASREQMHLCTIR